MLNILSHIQNVGYHAKYSHEDEMLLLLSILFTSQFHNGKCDNSLTRVESYKCP